MLYIFYHNYKKLLKRCNIRGWTRMGQNELNFDFLRVTGWRAHSFDQKLVAGLPASDVNPMPPRRWGTRSPKLAPPDLPAPRQPRAPQSADAERARPLVEPGRSSPGRAGGLRLPPDPVESSVLHPPCPVGPQDTLPRFRHLVPSAHAGRGWQTQATCGRAPLPPSCLAPSSRSPGRSVQVSL